MNDSPDTPRRPQQPQTFEEWWDREGVHLWAIERYGRRDIVRAAWDAALRSAPRPQPQQEATAPRSVDEAWHKHCGGTRTPFIKVGCAEQALVSFKAGWSAGWQARDPAPPAAATPPQPPLGRVLHDAVMARTVCRAYHDFYINGARAMQAAIAAMLLEAATAPTATALRSPPPPQAPASDLADRIVLRVAELPDRTSPDDWPEAMLVTADELRAIVSEEAPAAGADLRQRLHELAMNVQCDPNKRQPEKCWTCYGNGHRDARHAIAELLLTTPLLDGVGGGGLTAEVIGAARDVVAAWEANDGGSNGPISAAIYTLRNRLAPASAPASGADVAATPAGAPGAPTEGRR